jgi:hypothetical protein
LRDVCHPVESANQIMQIRFQVFGILLFGHSINAR